MTFVQNLLNMNAEEGLHSNHLKMKIKPTSPSEALAAGLYLWCLNQEQTKTVKYA
jgi:hypothetical protein